MRDEDLLKCPLLAGLDAMHRAELLGLLNNSNIRTKMEQCMAENEVKDWTDPEPTNAELAKTDPKPGDFDKEVHRWNPQKLVFSRSPKE